MKLSPYIKILLLAAYLVSQLAIFVLLINSGWGRYIGKAATKAAAIYLETEIVIENINIALPASIYIKNIYLEDQNKQPILKGDNIKVSLSILSLLKGRLRLKNVELNKLNINLAKNKDNVLNIQFIIDKFATEEEVDSDTEYQIDRLVINNCSFNYTTEDKSIPKTNFNPNNIRITNLNSDIILDYFTPNSIKGAIKSFSLEEESGFSINNFAFHFQANDTITSINKCSFEFPRSELTLDTLRLTYKPNAIFSDLTFYGGIRTGNIYLPDFAAFLPELRKLRSPINIGGHLTVHKGSINAEDITFKYGKDITFIGNCLVSNIDRLTNLNNIKVDAAINKLEFTTYAVQNIIANIGEKPFRLDPLVHNVGVCNYSGKIKGDLNKVTLKGQLTSNIGSVRTDVVVKNIKSNKEVNINGHIASKSLNLAKVTPKEMEVGELAFDIQTKFSLYSDNTFSNNMELNIEKLNFKNYLYENVHINGIQTPTEFNGDIHCDDPNFKFKFFGDLKFGNVNKFDFFLDLDNIDFANLNLVKPEVDLSLGLVINATFSGKKLEEIYGSLEVDSIFVHKGNKCFQVQEFDMVSFKDGDEKNFILRSDFINGRINGDYEMSSLSKRLNNLLIQHLPVLKPYFPKQTIKKSSDKIRLTFDIANSETLCDLLDLEWYSSKKSYIVGNFDSQTDDFQLDFIIPEITDGYDSFDNINLRIGKQNNGLAILTNARYLTDKDTINGFASIFGRNDSLNINFDWDNTNKKITNGSISIKNYLFNKDNKINCISSIDKSKIQIADSPFEIVAESVETNFDWVKIKNFNISGINQHIILNGAISKSEEDKLLVDLENINLDYIFSIIPKGSVKFGGLVSGKAEIFGLLSTPIFKANVVGEGISFNEAYYGKIIASSDWDNENKSLLFKGDIVSDQGVKSAELNGSFNIPGSYLDIKGKTQEFDLSFLNFYLSNILKDIKGLATGDVHIYGSTKKQQVSVEANAFIRNAQLTQDFIKATFFFSDSIKMTKNEIIFNNIAITDSEGNTGLIKGTVKHQYLKDMEFLLNIKMNNMIVLDLAKSDDIPFYGRVRATGGVLISGDKHKTDIIANVKTENNSKFTIPLDGASSIDNSFIKFINKNVTIESNKKRRRKANPKMTAMTQLSAALNIGLNLEVTPGVEIELQIDPNGGDAIRARGNGNLKIDFNVNNNDLKMYGNYDISQGSYLFTFQEAIRKDLKINQGSNLFWSGSPYSPRLAISAYYQTTASLLDILDESVLNSSNRTSVPVRCLLNLTGTLDQPQLKFDLTLPNSDEELNRALKATVNTDDLMNMQIIYLLVANKFYTPEYMKATTSPVGTNDLLAVASSTLSSQLNNWASQMFDNWNFGVNFRSTQGSSAARTNEYEFNFLYTPNNRLTINGNIGYRDNSLNNNNVIGDFDVEYKLTTSGNISAKAYTHTNDYNEFKSALTTQGIGFVYKESFSSLSDLWSIWKEQTKPKININKKLDAANRKLKKASKPSL